MIALELLKTNKTVAERAESFGKSIKRNIQRDILDSLDDKKEKMIDELFELKDFSLDTNLNAGKRRMTKDDCEERFHKIFNIEYELILLEMETKAKQASFDKYFNDEPAKKKA